MGEAGANLEPTLQQEDLERLEPLPEVPGYRLCDRLGEGTFGEVWRAEQISTGQQVAVKLLRPGAGLARELERLRAVCDHPHVVTLLDANLAHRPSFVVTPLLRSLPEVPWTTLADWFEQTARALQFVHSRGVLHCDLKPANLLLDREGLIQLVDFGQAVSLEQTPEASLGTLFFMAPEQARLETPSTAWDVYALGATFYQLLTGRLPREGAEVRENLDTRTRLAVYADSLARQPLLAVEGVDRELADILAHCLELDPARRYPDAGAVLADLDNRRRHFPLTCRPRKPLYLARCFVRRQRLPLAIAGGAALLLAATVVAAFVGVARERDQALLEATRSRERLAEIEFERALREAPMQTVLGLARAVALAPEPNQRVAALRPPDELARARHLQAVHRVAAQTCLEACPRLVERAPAPDGPVLSPDGHRRAVADESEVRLLEGDRVVARAPLALAQTLVFSPDGRTLGACGGGEVYLITPARVLKRRGYQLALSRSLAAVASEHRLEVLELDSGRQLWSLLTDALEPGPLAFGGDGAQLVSAQLGETRWYAARGGRLLRSLPVEVPMLSLAAQGSQAALGCGDGTLRLVPSVWAPALHEAPVDEVAFHGEEVDAISNGIRSRWSFPKPASRPTPVPLPAGALAGHGAAFLVAGSEWQEVERGSGRILRRQPGFAFDPPVVYSPEGTWAATCEIGGTSIRPLFWPEGRTWEVGLPIRQLAIRPGHREVAAGIFAGEEGDLFICPASGEPREVAHFPAPLSGLVYRPDGLQLLVLSRDGQATLLDTRTYNRVHVFRHPGKPVEAAAFSADGQRLVTGDESGRARVWDVETGLPLSPWLPWPGGPLEFSGDGGVALAGQFWPLRAPPGAGQEYLDRARRWTGLR